MKKYIIFLSLLLVFVVPCRAQYDNDNFKLLADNLQELTLNTHNINEDKVVAIDVNVPIYGLSISGSSVIPDKNSYVRVVLKSKEGKEFLVYETNSLFSSTISNTFSNVGLETLSLDGIVPDSLLIHVIEGTLTLDRLHYTTKKSTPKARGVTDFRTLQAEAIVEQLNENLQHQNKLWRAGITDIALMSYEDKKKLFGEKVPNLHGLEYYKGGIIDLSDIVSSNSSNLQVFSSQNEESNDNPLYYPITEFDWRNKDGINWMTHAKEQIDNSCWLFASVGMVEAAVNIGIERNLNYDLSEQEIVACGDMYLNVRYGGRPSDALNYILLFGVVDEECFPWSITGREVSCDEKGTTPEDVVYAAYRYYSIPPSLWKERIHESPCVLGISSNEYEEWGHAVVLTGYKEIEVGDVIIVDMPTNESIVINNYNKPSEKVAWSFKNSWGISWGDSGYGYFIVSDALDFELWQVTDIASQNYPNYEKVAVDSDGDGYYYWGLGSTPDNLPDWAPRKQDGDDNNANYGPVTDQGLLNLSPDLQDTIVFESNELWANENYIWQHVRIDDGIELSIIHDITMYKDATITVESGGVLSISDGYLYQAKVIVKKGGTLRITDDGMLKINNNDALIVEKGGVLDIQYGSIKLMD